MQSLVAISFDWNADLEKFCDCETQKKFQCWGSVFIGCDLGGEEVEMGHDTLRSATRPYQSFVPA